LGHKAETDSEEERPLSEAKAQAKHCKKALVGETLS
jgi:hypothetical protein